ncbi:MAG: sulfatase-like hydrolase/transferase [Bacteroidota bacterium]
MQSTSKVHNYQHQKQRFTLIIWIFFSVGILSLGSCKKDFSPIENPEDSSFDVGSFDKMGNSGKPNIIFIIGDDVGYEIPNYTGGESYNTPSLNYMASHGMQFNYAFSHPDGFPSRLAAFTGKYNFRNYINWGILPPGGHNISNLLHDAGYATCFVGKWQNDGGDAAIKEAGFDKYRVFLPFEYPSNQFKGRYKSPIIYENGGFLPDSITAGRYSEDMNVDYLDSFIDQNQRKPFFAVYSMPLVQKPWVPTPDDPEYATWDPKFDELKQDIKYFPSMVNYMDKKIGQIMKHIQAKGLRNNTMIIFTTDNATNVKISSLWRGQLVRGLKNGTVLGSTRQPLVAYWPRGIKPNQSTNTLVDFTDFLPTFSDIAKTPVPANYGTLDGVSFYDNLTGKKGIDRTWSFCQWDNNPTDNKPMIRYINDTIYKLYDEPPLYKRFYNMQIDEYELNPIPAYKQTDAEKQIRQNFIDVLLQMHN